MSENLNTTRPRLASPWIYFAAAYLWTWLFWGLAILMGANMETATGFILLLLGVIGLMVAAIGITAIWDANTLKREKIIRVHPLSWQ